MTAHLHNRLVVLAKLHRILAAVFMGVLIANTPSWLDQIAMMGKAFDKQTQRVASYMRTGDPTALDFKGQLELPYPSPDRLRSLLDDPVIRRAMPPEIRAPLPLEPAEILPSGAFVAEVDSRDIKGLASLPAFRSNKVPLYSNMSSFLSRPVNTQYPYVLIGIAGDVPRAELSLSIRCTGPLSCGIADVAPAMQFREQWHLVATPVPRAPWALLVINKSSKLSQWVSFTAPVEAGALSVASMGFLSWVEDSKLALVTIGGTLVTWLLLLASLRDPTRNRSNEQSSGVPFKGAAQK